MTESSLTGASLLRNQRKNTSSLASSHSFCQNTVMAAIRRGLALRFCLDKRRVISALVSAVAISLLGACSLIVNPDKDQLGTAVDGGTNTCSPANCDDQVGCTVDRCLDGICDNSADDALCESDHRCDPVAGCVPTACAKDEDCDNGNSCDGVETCVGSRCQAGEPIKCDDGIACTIDRCEAGKCSHEADDSACAYEDLCVTGTCGEHAEADERGCRPVSKSCDDGDVCTLDACNPDTGACESGILDADGDGVAAMTAGCGGSDCDDSNPSIHAGADELCNGRDDNCDGRTDDGCKRIPNTCADVLDVDVNKGQTRVIEFEISQFTDDYTSYCHGPAKRNGPDAVFRIRVSGEADVLVDTTESEFDTLVALSNGNCSMSDFISSVCDDDSPGTNALGSRIWRQRTGDFYLLIDSIEGATGKAIVKVSASEPEANLCGASLDISPGGTWIGRTRDQPYYQGPCTGAGREGVARFTSPKGGQATAEGIAFSNGFFNEGMYIYEYNDSDCNNAIACDGSGPLFLEASLKAGQTYVLFVDGGGANEPFAVKYTPP